MKVKVWVTPERNLLIDRSFTTVVLIFGALYLGRSETTPSRVCPSVEAVSVSIIRELG